jgi:hypothetical protein
MKQIALFLLLFTCATVSFAQGENDTPYQTKKFSNAGVNLVKVKTSGGAIRVEGGSNEGITAELYVKPNSWPSNLSEQEIENRLKGYDIVMKIEGETLILNALRKKELSNDWKTTLSIGFRVKCPAQLNTDLLTSGGSINLSNLDARQHFVTSGGSIHLYKVSGHSEGQTSGGSIHVEQSGGDIDIATSGGSVHADRVKGLIKLVTSGGSLHLNDIDGTLEAATSGGSIRGENLSGKADLRTAGSSINLLNVKASLKAVTAAGSITVEIAEMGSYLELSASAGSVRVDLPMQKGLNLDLHGDSVNMDTSNFLGTNRNGDLVGTLNGGGVPVKIWADSGRISVY